MYTSLEKLSANGQEIIELLCSTAKKGLANCYSRQNLDAKKYGLKNYTPHLSMAWHLRYIIIAQIGIKRWLDYHENDGDNLPRLWGYIREHAAEIKTPGDLALATWAAAETAADEQWIFLRRLIRNWHRFRQSCNAVELAWIVQAMVRFSQCCTLPDGAVDVLSDAKDRLFELHCPASGLFARHKRKGFTEIISRRVACFADQVYPIMALANYGEVFRDDACLDIAVQAADTICRLQGAEGQWWWHYDVQSGVVAEEYPVFTVHQDAMAPMALLAIDSVAGTDHSRNIEKGLLWCTRSSISPSMVISQEGIIWRDVHRREIHKMYRAARDALIAGGLRDAHRIAGKNLFGYTVNRECRPYHLGWILYAWAGQVT